MVLDEWNDSFSGDFLWTNSNFCEAISDVMTPATISMWKIYTEAVPFSVPGYPLIGIIGGRPYINLSVLASIGRLLGMDSRVMLQRAENLWGRIPEGVDIPQLPLTTWQLIRTMLPALVKVRMALHVSQEEIQAFIASCPQWCTEMRGRIRQMCAPVDLAVLWRAELRPYFGKAWRIGRAALDSSLIGRLRRNLIARVGEADANALLSNLCGSEQLASLGPLVGLSKVACNRMSREDYLQQYGHRGPHELELSVPRVAEDPGWLDQQVAMFVESPVDVEQLLEAQRAKFDAAWERFLLHDRPQAEAVRQQINRVGTSARCREEARSEATRVIWVVREFALRVSELTDLENREDIFYLTLDEMIEILSGDKTALAHIPTRREIHARYSALPPYPAIIIGHFDPFQWAADPNRRNDLFDARLTATPVASKVTGFAGAAGRVEGIVRRIDSPEAGEQLQPGEILVTTTTNIGWTPLFPRCAAVVTDVGAPLSHAAIVARELGIPAVVGCGNATTILQTGDRICVDGGQGTVEILERNNL